MTIEDCVVALVAAVVVFHIVAGLSVIGCPA